MKPARKVKLKHYDDIKNSTALETHVKISLMMADFDHWDNGDYKGDRELIKRQTESVIMGIEEWVKSNYVNPIRIKNETI